MRVIRYMHQPTVIVMTGALTKIVHKLWGLFTEGMASRRPACLQQQQGFCMKHPSLRDVTPRRLTSEPGNQGIQLYNVAEGPPSIATKIQSKLSTLGTKLIHAREKICTVRLLVLAVCFPQKWEASMSRCQFQYPLAQLLAAPQGLGFRGSGFPKNETMPMLSARSLIPCVSHTQIKRVQL